MALEFLNFKLDFSGLHGAKSYCYIMLWRNHTDCFVLMIGPDADSGTSVTNGSELISQTLIKDCKLPKHTRWFETYIGDREIRIDEVFYTNDDVDWQGVPLDEFKQTIQDKFDVVFNNNSLTKLKSLP